MTQHTIKKGYDINLVGKAEKTVSELPMPSALAIQPPDFRWLRPRLLVAEGDKVKAGTALFQSKANERVIFVSPVSGSVKAIKRGARRAIMEIVITPDGSNEAENVGTFTDAEIAGMDRETAIDILLKGGLFPYLRQRPFSIIPDPDSLPRAIFISGLDSAPLAADMSVLMDGQEADFQSGVRVISRLTEGNVYLSWDGSSIPAFEKAEGVEKHSFSGPHPAGNVSVQIYSIAPLKHNETVWYLSAPAVAYIGKLFKSGVAPVERVVAVAGSAVKSDHRKYVKTVLGAPVSKLAEADTLESNDVRFISGNVLAGRQLDETGYLGFYDNLLTIIPEGRSRELMGWLSPGLHKPSFSRTFLSALNSKKPYVQDTKQNGGLRAFVQTGEYQKVMPMNILPDYLLKSIIAEDIEEMEGLGLLDTDTEDFALCSYICPSKINFESYILKGLDLMEKEG